MGLVWDEEADVTYGKGNDGNGRKRVRKIFASPQHPLAPD